MTESLPPPTSPSVDPLLDPRLQRLAQRSAAARAARTPAAPAGRNTPKPAVPLTARTNGRTNGRTKKRHAAKGSRTAALALSAASTLALAGYFHSVDASAVSSNRVITVAATGTGSTTATTPNTVASSTTAMSSSTTSSSSLADGTYTGDADANRWGAVQVQMTVSGGQISDVGIVQYPDGASKSVRINERALPTLVTETLTAQNADVDTVSGATYTSDSYRISLQSAIDLAAVAAQG